MIINSLLDSDYYKFTMGNFIFNNKPNKKKYAEYSMKCRSGQDLIPLKKQIIKEIEHWLSLKFTEDEIQYLADQKINGTKVFKDNYIEFLKAIDLKSNIKYRVVIEKGQLNIRVEGEWKYSIYAEVPMLAIVQELYWNSKLNAEEYSQAEKTFAERLDVKIEYLKTTKVRFAEFGTRRRFSLKMQRLAVTKFKDEARNHLLGTSNVLLAKELGLPCIGSIAHEIFQGYQALASSFEKSQKELLQDWVAEYPDKLKIALTDIFGTDMFLIDFNKDLALAYDGLRQDSGVPREVGMKYKAHYEKLGIPTQSKTVLFSDDLNFQKANDLEVEFGQIFNTTFGLGTYCSNDTGHKPVSLVMKMVRMNGIDVIKVSDSEGKIMCENEDKIIQTKTWIKETVEAHAA